MHEAIATTPQFEGLLTFVKCQGFGKGKPAFGVISSISWRRQMELAHMRRDVTYCVSWNGVGVSNSKYGVGYSISGVNNAKCGVGAFWWNEPQGVQCDKRAMTSLDRLIMVRDRDSTESRFCTLHCRISLSSDNCGYFVQYIAYFHTHAANLAISTKN